MGKEKKKEKTGKKKVVFTLNVDGAVSVSLMADFNNWDDKKHPMKKEHNEIWKKAVFLNPGRYEYRFLVDGEWRNDSKNNQLCENRFGTYNNFLVVL
jgi:1,4-alpha-glucan branching enzyme